MSRWSWRRRQRSRTSAAPPTGRQWRRPSREPGHVVVIRGEAGVGKSALVAAERATAITDVIEGSCLQLAGQPLPLAALEQIFDARGGWPSDADGRTSRSPEQRLKAVRQWAEALVPVGRDGLDHPRRRGPALGRRDHLRLPRLPGQHRAADAGSAWWSRFATTRRRGWAGSSRSSPELARLPGAVDVELGRLDRADAAELVALLTGGAAGRPRCLVRAVAGQPLSAGRTGQGPRRPPRQGRAALPGPRPGPAVGRARRAGGDLRALGERRTICSPPRELTPGAYAAAVREAMHAGVLVVDGADYAFRHSLMCEAVLSQLLPIERRMLHERAARTLGAGAADDVVTAASVSLHWSAAGVPDQAAEWSLRAARKARQRNAFAEAWGYYRRASGRGRRPGAGPDGLDLILEAAGTARLAGDPAAAAALLEARAVHVGCRGGRARVRAGAAGLLPLGGGADRAERRGLHRGRGGARRPRSPPCTPRCGARRRARHSSWPSSTRRSRLAGPRRGRRPRARVGRRPRRRADHPGRGGRLPRRSQRCRGAARGSRAGPVRRGPGSALPELREPDPRLRVHGATRRGLRRGARGPAAAARVRPRARRRRGTGLQRGEHAPAPGAVRASARRCSPSCWTAG